MSVVISNAGIVTVARLVGRTGKTKENDFVILKLIMLVCVLCDGRPKTRPSTAGRRGSPSGSQFSNESESSLTWLKPS